MTTLWSATGWTWTTGAVIQAWDYGVTHAKRRTVDPIELPVSVAYVRDQVLRVSNGSAEDEFIQNAIRAAVDVYEDETLKALMAQTWEVRLDGFPSSGWIELPRTTEAPLIAVDAFGYYDSDGDAQALVGSPADYVVIPSGKYTPAQLRPLAGASFPSTYGRLDAVTVTYRCGYESADRVPMKIVSGIGLLAGELYKQRSLSQLGTASVVATPLQTSRFWKRAW